MMKLSGKEIILRKLSKKYWTIPKKYAEICIKEKFWGLLTGYVFEEYDISDDE